MSWGEEEKFHRVHVSRLRRVYFKDNNFSSLFIFQSCAFNFLRIISFPSPEKKEAEILKCLRIHKTSLLEMKIEIR